MTSRAQADATSDADLLRAHADGDPQAFAELVRRHRDRLWAVALRTIGDREEAADAVQDALLAAHRNAARFRGESAVTTWLHRIVVNACLDRIRRRQAHPTVPLPDGSRSDDRPSGVEPAAPVQDHDTALVVREALAALPPDQRAAIVLVDVQGYPVAEAAEILGVAEGTIKSRCARGRARMAIALGHLRGGITAEPGDSPAARRAGSAVEPGDKPVAGRAGSAAEPRDNPVAGRDGGAAEPDNSDTPAAPKRRGLPRDGVSPAVSRRGGAAAGRQQTDSAAVSKRDGIAAEPEDNESAAESRRGGVAGGPKDSGNSAALRSRGSKDDDVPSEPIGDGAPARTAGGGTAASGARDTGHEAGGNQSGARSVPSGPAAASGPRPGTHERRDQR